MKLGAFIMGCVPALLACTLAGCDDHLEVRWIYDFSLSFWYPQEGIVPDETVEIRLTLGREGDYREARYRIGYIQPEGNDEVPTADGVRLVNRELTGLSGIMGLDTTNIHRQAFTLFYRDMGEDNPGIYPMAVDNSRAERALDIPSSVEDRVNMDTTDQRKIGAMTRRDKYSMEQLAGCLDTRIRHEKETAKEIRNKLDRDCFYHFTWIGKELFKPYFTVKQRGELHQVIRQVGVPGEAHGYIRHKREEYLKELVGGSIRRHSTGDVSNLAHAYQLECMQRLVKDYMGFGRLLPMKAPQKEIRTKKVPERKRPDGLKTQCIWGRKAGASINYRNCWTTGS